jgi:predicted nucleic acid-binding protein
MGAFYLDSSALVKRYVQEAGTAWVTEIVAPTSANSVYMARLSAVEVISALTRRERAGTCAPAEADAARAQFRRELSSQYRAVDLGLLLIDVAMAIAERHGLRGYDAVQLAAALSLRDELAGLNGVKLVLVSADGELNAAAEAEGLDVENPNEHL